MKNMKFWRTALVATLVLTVMLSVTGGTIAWFTDTVESKSNKIEAGNLDVALLMDTGSGYTDISGKIEPIFGTGSIAQNNNAATLWEPGKTQVAYLAIQNNGNLALKYKVSLLVKDEVNNLSQAMEYAITPNAQYGDVTAWAGEGNDVTVGTQEVSSYVSLGVGQTHYFALSIHMKETAGNEYQGGEVSFDLTVQATQDTVESDSFGNQYDANATYQGDAPKEAWPYPDVIKEDTVFDGSEYTNATEYGEISHEGGNLTIKNVVFENGLKIYSKDQNVTGTVTLENCTIYLNNGEGNPNSEYKNEADYGLYLGANSPHVEYVFKNCTFTAKENHTYTNAQNNSYNVYIGGGYSADSITFEGCTFEGSGKHGIGCSYAYSTDANNPFTYYNLKVTGCEFLDWNNNNQNGAAIRGNVPADVLTKYNKSINISGNTFGENNGSNKADVVIDGWNGTWN